MTISKYQEIYLSSAQSALGDAFDYAVNSYHISGDDFVKMFIVSSVSKKMERGEASYLIGKSGIEIVMDIIYETKGEEVEVFISENYGRSKEYWIGWAVAYYQLYSDRKYSEIFAVVSFEELGKMYYTLHEADITKFVEIIDIRMKEHFKQTNLKRFRSINRLTQAELAKQSGVSLRSIAMYEQKNKDINKARAEVIYKLSKALRCEMEDLIEK
jgi:hypothetical protein